MQSFSHIGDLLSHMEKNYSFPDAFNDYQDNQWHSCSTVQFLTEVKYICLALSRIIKQGDRVGILAPPSTRWSIVDFAIIAAGGIVVPLFANISEENFLFETEQAEIKIIFVAEEEPWEMCQKHKSLFKTIVALDDISREEEEIPYQDLLLQGKIVEQEEPDSYKRLLEQLSTHDVATIIYSSGSTGRPKGVELTQRNLFSLIHVNIFDWGPKDKYLSILPLAHIFARTMNFILIGWGVKMYYFNELKNISSICKMIHPSLMIVVPRLLERIYTKIVDNIEHAGFFKRKVGEWALQIASKEEEGGVVDHLCHSVADRLVFSHLREALGGNLRVVISGGAALSPHLNHFYISIGVPIYEGWGLTEACPVTVNLPKACKIGFIGKPIEGMELKIGKDNEILIRGPLVMKGYYKEPQMTTEALEKDGWLHTGDKGSMDADGFVKIEGRLREIYKTSTGEMVAPVPIEQELVKHPIVDMALVIGDQRKFVSCLLFPNLDVVHEMKKNLNQEILTDEEFLNSPEIRQEMDAFIEKLNQQLNHWAQIHAYHFILTPISVTSGELTPSLKIRRDYVIEKFGKEIDAMYAER